MLAIIIYDILTNDLFLLDLGFGWYLQDDRPIILVFNVDQHLIHFFVIILGFDYGSTLIKLLLDFLPSLF